MNNIATIKINLNLFNDALMLLEQSEKFLEVFINFFSIIKVCYLIFKKKY